MSMDVENLNRMILLMNQAIEAQGIAGASVLVFQNGEELFQSCRGLADRESGTPIKRDTIYRMYSMSKPITAAAAMRLYERGDLDLMAPVSTFLPGFRNQRVAVNGGFEPVPAARPCLVKDLLGMTSGLVYPGSTSVAECYMDALFKQVKSEQDAGRGPSTQEFANRMGEQPLLYAPGTSWKYGVSADVLGAVIEAAAGKPFSQVLKEEVFEPLGMTDSGFTVPEEKKPRLSKVYRETEEGLAPHSGCHLCVGPTEATGFESGGAGLFSTIDDYGRFAKMLTLGGALGNKQFLSRKTWDFMRSPQLSPVQQEAFDKWLVLNGYSYGNLMRVCVSPGRSYMPGSAGEFGWDGWLGTHFLADPAEKLTFVFAIQRADSGTIEITRKLRAVLYSALK